MNLDIKVLQAEFADFIAFMVAQKRSAQSIKDYAQTFKLYIQDGYTFIDDANAKTFLARYTNQATWNKRLAHLRSFVSWYMKAKGGTGVVGSFTLEQYKLALTLPIIVTDAESDAIISALGQLNARTWAHAVILKNTGLRFNEARMLTWKHFYEPEPGIFALKFRGKGRKERIVVLNEDAYLGYETWCRLTPKGPPAEQSLREWYHKAFALAGVKIKPHWFRHTVATKLRNDGQSYEDIADLLGNTVEVCRERYSHMNYRGQKRMVAKL